MARPPGLTVRTTSATASAEAELKQIMLKNTNGNDHLIFRGSTPTIQKVKLYRHD
jgi:hypothetical protein